MSMIPNVTVPEGTAGLWSIERFTVEVNSLERLRAVRDGRAMPAGTYTRLRHMHRGTIMSDTPAEKRDHMGFIWEAKGRVLINGLGLGMCLGAVLLKNVESVTVVEMDADVISLVADHYADPRVTIVHASAFDYQPPKGAHYNAVWHDIWDAICSDNLPEMHRLHHKYGRRADWQGSWGREIAEYQLRRWG